MIHWHDKIYLGEDIKSEYKNIRAKLEKGESPFGLYVIALSSNKSEQLDIFRADMFTRSRRLYPEPTVVGLARGKKEAEGLVALMAFDSYEKTGKVDLRKLFDLSIGS